MSNFDDIFNSKILSTSKLMIENLNSDLPMNTTYKISADGKELHLCPTDKCFIEDVNIIYPETFLKLNNGKKDFKKLENYCKNTMTNIIVSPKKGNNIKINGKSFNINKAVLNRYGNEISKNCSILLIPRYEKELINCNLFNKLHTKEFILKQIPYESIDTALYYYEEGDYFSFSIYVNQETGNILFKFHSVMGKYPSLNVGLIIESLKESFVKSELHLNKIVIKSNNINKNYVNYNILQKLSVIQEKTKHNFVFPLGIISHDDIKNILIVYSSLINNLPVYIGKIKSLNLEFEKEMPEYIFKDKLVLSLCKNNKIKICNDELCLFGCFVYIKLQYHSHMIDDKIIKVKLIDINDEGIEEKVRYFVSEKEFELSEKEDSKLREKISMAQDLQSLFRYE